MLEKKSEIKFNQNLKTFIKIKRREIRKAKWKTFFNFIDIPFSIKSFFFILPLFFVLIITIDIFSDKEIVLNSLRLNVNYIYVDGVQSIGQLIGTYFYIMFLLVSCQA